jgi:hypothetical protein
MTHDAVQRWLDRYLEAWKTYDAAEIGDLFSADAEYRYVPWDVPVKGREAIVADWLAPRGDPARADPAGTIGGEYAPFAVEGDRAVAIGTTTYYTDTTRTKVARKYWNAWLLEFDVDRRCRSFVEYYLKPSA